MGNDTAREWSHGPRTGCWENVEGEGDGVDDGEEVEDDTETGLIRIPEPNLPGSGM